MDARVIRRWTFSVAQASDDAYSYFLYVHTPTHNLTLVRTALEIFELHDWLRETLPDVELPALPIDVSALPQPPPKRRAGILDALSRIAGRQVLQSPLERLQPSDRGEERLAAYLTTLANDASVRQAGRWKRFIRVRTDDLQSVRVERSIKRVRSDLDLKDVAEQEPTKATETEAEPQAKADSESKELEDARTELNSAKAELRTAKTATEKLKKELQEANAQVKTQANELAEARAKAKEAERLLKEAESKLKAQADVIAQAKRARDTVSQTIHQLSSLDKMWSEVVSDGDGHAALSHPNGNGNGAPSTHRRMKMPPRVMSS